MAQRTDVDIPLNPPPATAQAAPPPDETHSATPPPPDVRKALHRSPAARMFAIGAVLVLLVGGFFAWRYFMSYESTDDAQIDGHLMPLSARISGYVAKVNVDDNQYMQAGTVLVEIDPRDYQVALEQARATAADAQATAESEGINVPVTSVSTSSQTSSTEADVQDATAGVA